MNNSLKTYPSSRIVERVQIGNAAVAINRQVRYVAGGAADPVEDIAAALGGGGLVLSCPGLK